MTLSASVFLQFKLDLFFCSPKACRVKMHFAYTEEETSSY